MKTTTVLKIYRVYNKDKHTHKIYHMVHYFFLHRRRLILLYTFIIILIKVTLYIVYINMYISKSKMFFRAQQNTVRRSKIVVNTIQITLTNVISDTLGGH